MKQHAAGEVPKLGQRSSGQLPKQLIQLLPLRKVELRNQIRFRSAHGLHASFVSDTAFIGYLGPNRAAVGWIGNAADQLVRLEPVHQLSDVGFYARYTFSELPQGKWLVRVGQMLQRPKLGEGKTSWLQRAFQPILDHMGGVHYGGEQVVRVSHI